MQIGSPIPPWRRCVGRTGEKIKIDTIFVERTKIQLGKRALIQHDVSKNQQAFVRACVHAQVIESESSGSNDDELDI